MIVPPTPYPPPATSPPEPEPAATPPATSSKPANSENADAVNTPITDAECEIETVASLSTQTQQATVSETVIALPPPSSEPILAAPPHFIQNSKTVAKHIEAAQPAPVVRVESQLTEHKREQVTLPIATEANVPRSAQSTTHSSLATIQPLTTTQNTMTSYIIIQIFAMSLGWLVIAEGHLDSWQFGVVFIALAVYMRMQFLPPLRTHWHPLIGLYFIGFFIWESIVGGWDIARRTLSPSLPIAPHWFTYPMQLPSGIPRSLFINSVSLMPGTLSVKLTKEGLLIHALTDDVNVQQQLYRLEHLIAKMFFMPLTDAAPKNSPENNPLDSNT